MQRPARFAQCRHWTALEQAAIFIDTLHRVLEPQGYFWNANDAASAFEDLVAFRLKGVKRRKRLHAPREP
ncbi:hypothetical protein AB3G45_29450 [Shinella sp. S4-D37]|uniref:hypothetical protein n=1 Tax=Shinella sp. S4-D37 TaxID=3161999 RepID=UPI0034660FBD